MQGVFKDVKAPNVYLREIDRSAYDNDRPRSEVDTNVVVCGFAQKGPSLEPKQFIRLDDFARVYGYPTNEAERYFHAASNEVLEQGGTLIACRLPYDNNSYEHVTYCEYEVKDELDDVSTSFPELAAAYPGISSFLSVSAQAVENGVMTYNDWDAYVTGSRKPGKNRFTIVDITGNKFVRDDYYKDKFPTESAEDGWTNQYIGIIPVIVSPLNALVYQSVLSVDDASFYKYNLVSNLSTISDFSKTLSNVLPFELVNTLSSTNFESQLSSSSITTESIGKTAVETCFPQISYDRNAEIVRSSGGSEDPGVEYGNSLDKTYLNQIGVVVCRMYANPNNDNRIAIEPIESFVGSLNPAAVDSVTGASIYIGDIINTTSRYINFFSNIDFTKQSPAMKADILAIANQTAYSMGFFDDDTADSISYKHSISDALEKIFGKIDDTRSLKIDLVVDAGVSNIAQYIKTFNGNDTPGKYAPQNEHIADFLLDPLTSMAPYNSVRQQYERFCRYTRNGDCMFITDSPRPLALVGSAKVVRPAAPSNSVENSVLPKLKYIPVMNSCYAAGYATWFMILDPASKTYVWVPPSTKALGKYIYTDRVARPWYAPAGLNRGVIENVFDIAFNPKNSEAGVLYSNSWNYAVATTFNGIIQEGQRTFQLKPTALDRVNVRRLMSEIEKRVADISKYYLYEQLTTANLTFFENDVSKYLSKVQTGEGIEEYVVIADETNNNANTIDNNELHCMIGVRPIKSVEYIFLTFVVTNQSVNVREATIAAVQGQ